MFNSPSASLEGSTVRTAIQWVVFIRTQVEAETYFLAIWRQYLFLLLTFHSMCIMQIRGHRRSAHEPLCSTVKFLEAEVYPSLIQTIFSRAIFLFLWGANLSEVSYCKPNPKSPRWPIFVLWSMEEMPLGPSEFYFLQYLEYTHVVNTWCTRSSSFTFRDVNFFLTLCSSEVQCSHMLTVPGNS